MVNTVIMLDQRQPRCNKETKTKYPVELENIIRMPAIIIIRCTSSEDV